MIWLSLWLIKVFLYRLNIIIGITIIIQELPNGEMITMNIDEERNQVSPFQLHNH